MANKLAVEIGDVTPANIEQLKTLNVSALPVRYSTKFYKDLLNNVPPQYIKFAFWNGFTVGAICCRVEDHKNEETGTKGKRLYIMTLSVLPAYRRRGVARFLVDHVLTSAAKDNSINDVYLHVQTSNEDALGFYEKLGFLKGEKLEGYYKRVDPPDCYIVSKTLKS
jgi:N-alpha-acetyltransferase 50